MDFSKLSKEEKIELLTQAKDAYYNTGQQIMSDWEYDQLEAEVGLENVNYVGSKSGNYTIKHSFIMGSLSKIQIHEDKTTKAVDWDKYAAEFTTYMRKAKNPQYYETTPKLDGCSFSAEFTVENGEYKLISCATRGDGEYGTDISHLFEQMLSKSEWSMINDACVNLLDEGDILCIRGEILIPHSTFTEEYAKNYTNPRSFVAGTVNSKASDVNKKMVSNLHFVCYDYRIIDGASGKFSELSWMNPKDPTYRILSPYLNYIGELPNKEFCQVHEFNGSITGEELQEIYYNYDQFRAESSEYALDGIVFKPNCSSRKYNSNRERPVDCVAMKFLPMSDVTEIIDILWTTKKSDEYNPIAIVKPVWLDGKKCQKASLYNYNYIVKYGCGIGSTVEIILSGDIIPKVQNIISAAGADNLNLPEDSEIVETPTGLKLYKIYAEGDLTKFRNRFVTSATELGINNIGPAAAGKLWDLLHTEYDYDLDNVVYLMNNESYELIRTRCGISKSISNIITSLKQFAAKLSVYDIIRSCCIPGCRDKSAQICVKIICGLPYDTRSISRASYQWALDENNEYYQKVMALIELTGLSVENEASSVSAAQAANADKIPVVMTGSPKSFGYSTKAEFLKAHPEYTDAGSSVKDCKILFTDDLSSTSGKMKQAAKYGVEVRLYEHLSFI